MPMTVAVLLFASYGDVLGRASLPVTLAAPPTAGAEGAILPPVADA